LGATGGQNQDPIGHTIEFGNMDGDLRLLTIVGIVGDTHEYGLDVPPRPTVYVNLLQRPRAAITVTMLSDADTRLVGSAARGILQHRNPEIPAKLRTLSSEKGPFIRSETSIPEQSGRLEKAVPTNM
jgi:putative ABC transport system permease protein